MKFFVTGSHSDLGRQLVAYLLLHGHEVVGFDRMKLPDDYPVYSDGEKPRCVRFLGDVRDYAAVSEGASICDGVIHLAYIADSEQTEDDPAAAIEYNLLGAVNVLRACRQFVKRGVYVVPDDSRFVASDIVFRYNAKHETEVAVVKFAGRVTTETLAQLVGCFDQSFFSYEHLIPLVPKLEVITT